MTDLFWTILAFDACLLVLAWLVEHRQSAEAEAIAERRRLVLERLAREIKDWPRYPPAA